MASRSSFDKFAAIDCETSGLNFDNTSIDITDGYQSVSWGIIITDLKTLKPIDELYVEIQWDGESKWHWKAEQVHGLTKAYLAENGMPEQEAAETIAMFLAGHFEVDSNIICMGHNVARFDIPFFKKLLGKYGFNFDFSHRSIDTFSLAVLTIGAYDSQDMFDYLGIPRGKVHNALEDIRATLQAARLIRRLYRDK